MDRSITTLLRHALGSSGAWRRLWASSLSLGLVACAPAFDPAEIEAGGAGTVYDTTRLAYTRSLRNLSREERNDFSVGNNVFGDNWVIAPSSTEGRDGLGPVFNARACGSCHLNDGRGRPPEPDEGEMLSMLVRLSVPGEGEHGGPLPEPTYGLQFQPRSIPDVPSEGATSLTWEEVEGTYGDGTPYTLRRPVLAFSTLSFGPMADGVLTSLRVAPSVYGLGLLEAVPAETIEALADPDDMDGDGISGRTNHVWDVERGAVALGRFGWKANEPTIRQQTAGAFSGDIGITSPIFPDPQCGPTQEACWMARDGGAPEVPDVFFELLVFYGRTLGVPARRDAEEPEVLRGRALFRAAGCDGCHVPELRTGVADVTMLSDQRIWPYTDLLLHDLGEGLADGRPDFEASGSEWRTPPLWGIGLLEAVSRHTLLLHDGRARGFAEAILWHGGEAEAAREAFRTMGEADRAALVRFLESL